MMQIVLRRLDFLDKAHNPPPTIKKVWVRKDETIHLLRRSGTFRIDDALIDPSLGLIQCQLREYYFQIL
jgi:hypothetical protein